MDILVLEAVPLGILWYELLEAWAQEVLQDPELDRCLGGFHHREHHDLEKALIEVTGRHTEDVESFIFHFSFSDLFPTAELIGDAENCY